VLLCWWMNSILIVIVAGAALLAGCVSSSADEKQPHQFLGEVSLDIDGDGRVDRIALAQNEQSGDFADLYIYLKRGTVPLDLTLKPSFQRAQVIRGHVYQLSGHNASLIVEGRCGGCTNDYDFKLTIAYRSGRPVVAGLTNDWDREDGSVGGCDVNFLTGRGFLTKTTASPSIPIKVTVKPVPLSDWSEKKIPKPCRG
jgi:hypothetical protein